MRQLWLALGLTFALWPLAGTAQDVRLTQNRLEATFNVGEQIHIIARNQDQANTLSG